MSKAYEALKSIDLGKVSAMDLNELGKYLTEDINIFRDIDTLKIFLLSSATTSLLKEKAAFPIRYNEKYEIEDDIDYLDTTDENLTDEYIQKNLNK